MRAKVVVRVLTSITWRILPLLSILVRATFLTGGLIAVAVVPAQGRYLGDLDGNEQANADDVLIIARIVVGLHAHP